MERTGFKLHIIVSIAYTVLWGQRMKIKIFGMASKQCWILLLIYVHLCGILFKANINHLKHFSISFESVAIYSMPTVSTISLFLCSQGFGRAARTLLLRLINTQNGTLRTLPFNRSFYFSSTNPTKYYISGIRTRMPINLQLYHLTKMHRAGK